MIIGRMQARARGLSRYFTGKPCLRGHVSERYVFSANCVACSIEDRGTVIPDIVSLRGESWKTIPGYKNLYEVSNFGRVRSLARIVPHPRKALTIQERILTSNVEPTGTGYCYVFLSRAGKPKRFRVHTLVLTTFVGPAPDGKVCRHLDSDPTNNKLENLCWGTPTENIADEYARGHSPLRNFKLSFKDAARIRRLRGKMTQKAIAAEYGVSGTTIANIHQGKTWKE